MNILIVLVVGVILLVMSVIICCTLQEIEDRRSWENSFKANDEWLANRRRLKAKYPDLDIEAAYSQEILDGIKEARYDSA